MMRGCWSVRSGVVLDRAVGAGRAGVPDVWECRISDEEQDAHDVLVVPQCCATSSCVYADACLCPSERAREARGL